MNPEDNNSNNVKIVRPINNMEILEVDEDEHPEVLYYEDLILLGLR
jgi:hypothetical protein